MEAWLAGTPVIANGAEAVVALALRALRRRPRLRRRLRARAVSALRRGRAGPRRRAGHAGSGLRARQLHLARHARPHGSQSRRMAVTQRRARARATAAAARTRADPAASSPYPPWRDGIGAYAVQQVRALARLGHHVEVLSPYPSAAHHHLDLVGPAVRLLSGGWPGGFDRMVVQFHPDIFYRVPATPGSRLVEGSRARRRVPGRPAGRGPVARGGQPLGGPFGPVRPGDPLPVPLGRPHHGPRAGPQALMVDRFGVRSGPCRRWSITARTSSAEC